MCRMPKGVSDFKILREEGYVYIDTLMRAIAKQNI